MHPSSRRDPRDHQRLGFTTQSMFLPGYLPTAWFAGRSVHASATSGITIRVWSSRSLFCISRWGLRPISGRLSELEAGLLRAEQFRQLRAEPLASCLIECLESAHVCGEVAEKVLFPIMPLVGGIRM